MDGLFCVGRYGFFFGLDLDLRGLEVEGFFCFFSMRKGGVCGVVGLWKGGNSAYGIYVI